MDTNLQTNQRNNCWEYYVETISFGNPNAYQSALKAGYSDDHARNITLQGWFKDKMAKLERKNILSKAEKILSDILELPHLDTNSKVDFGVLKMKFETAKHITSTLGKKVGYSEKIDEDQTSVEMVWGNTGQLIE